jgi:hypothetical protein
MDRWRARGAPGQAPPEQVFRELLAETLRPTLERQPPTAIDAARHVLDEAVATIEREILLVEPPPGRRGPRSRSRRPRRPQ